VTYDKDLKNVQKQQPSGRCILIVTFRRQDLATDMDVVPGVG
jgi:hypothetical protein